MGEYLRPVDNCLFLGSAGGGEPKVVPVAMEFISPAEDGSVKTLKMDITGE